MSSTPPVPDSSSEPLEDSSSDTSPFEPTPFDSTEFAGSSPDANETPTLASVPASVPAPVTNSVANSVAATEPPPALVEAEAASESPAPRRAWIWILLLVLLLIGGGIGGTLFYLKRERDRFDAWRTAKLPMSEAMARVPGQWKVATLATRLQESGKIRHAPTFLEAAEALNLQSVSPGGYELPETAAPSDLARVFKNGPTHERVTFPEGFTGLQIAARLEKSGFTNAQKLENLIYPAQGISSIEGTLFPDTYWLPLEGDAPRLVARMQENFQSKIKSLPRPFPRVDGKELTVRELVTLASIVEREAASRQEMPLVAGVMLNRLRRPMRLQVDATIQYARVLTNKGHKPRLLLRDLKIDSPFNTYQNDGLPPSPISNPGLSALRAVARPASTDALFYVYSPKLKKHRFSRSYDEFLRNKRLAATERRELEAAP